MYLKMKKFTDISVFFLSFLTSLGIIANRNTIVDVTQSCKFYIFGHDSIEEWRENTFKKIKRMRKGTHLLKQVMSNWDSTDLFSYRFLLYYGHLPSTVLLSGKHDWFSCIIFVQIKTCKGTLFVV